MLERSFSLVSLTALVIASMIGAGVFTTSGFALADLGTPGRVLLAWFVGGLIAFCGALSYGALAHRSAVVRTSWRTSGDGVGERGSTERGIPTVRMPRVCRFSRSVGSFTARSPASE